MFREYLFLFGYETPAESELNDAAGFDDESSTGLWIAAASEDEAMAWGRIVAETVVASLFARAGKSSYSWKEQGFAHWLEKDPVRLSAASSLPRVTAGEFPAADALTGRL